MYVIVMSEGKNPSTIESRQRTMFQEVSRRQTTQLQKESEKERERKEREREREREREKESQTAQRGKLNTNPT